MKTLATALMFGICGLNLFAADALQPERVLYVGQRTNDFVPFLREHFAKVESAPREGFQPAQAADFDVVVLDWPQSGNTRGAWNDGSPLGPRDAWNKPTVLLGSAGLNLAVAWKLKGGSGCTCLAPVAYDLRDHPIFKSPIPIDITATTNIPTPKSFSKDLKTPTISVIPLVDGIQDYGSVITAYKPGWSTHYFEFADMPEVEVFSGGINEQTPHSAAFWRQGNLLHFGFEQSPAELNQTGRAMLVNGIVYISHFNEDRPIDVTPSVFGEKIGITRDRARNRLISGPDEVYAAFSGGTLAALEWTGPMGRRYSAFLPSPAAPNQDDLHTTLALFDEARPWLHPNADKLLEIDPEAKALGTPFDAPDFLPKTIAALHDEKTREAAEHLLERYIYKPLTPGSSAEQWDQWWHDNGPYVFYSELANYQWYVDPLAKKRGTPTKDLRGPARMDMAAGGR